MKSDEKKISVASCQSEIALEKIDSGMVINDKGEYIKIFEVKSAPFLLKKAKDQNRISDSFQSFLKIAPDRIHIKTMTVDSSLQTQLERVRCCDGDSSMLTSLKKDYRQTLINAQTNTFQHRYFISFAYDNKGQGYDSQRIACHLQNECEKLQNALLSCENESVVHNCRQQDDDNLNLFYTLYNRSSYHRVSLNKRKQQVEKRYGDSLQSIRLSDLLAPQRISYNDRDYLEIDNRYYSFLYIDADSYPLYSIAGWLNPFINSYDGVDTDIFLNRVDSAKIMNKIRTHVAYSKANMSEASDMDDTFQSGEDVLSSGYYLKKGLSHGQDYYNAAVLISVSDESKARLEDKISALETAMIAQSIRLRRCRYHNEEAFKAVLPSSMMDDGLFFRKMQRNMLSEGACSLYPFIGYQLEDEKGVYICDDLQSNSPAVIDFFNRNRLINPHIFLCGASGSGKTVSLSILSTRMLVADPNCSIFILAPEKEDELRRLTESLGGQFVSIGAGSKDRINIMEIFEKEQSSGENNRLIYGAKVLEKSLLEEKMTSVLEFLQLHISRMSIDEKQLISEAITNTYRTFGITDDNRSLYNDDHSGYKKMPTLSDLVNELEKMDESKRMYRAVKLLTQGSCSFFDGQTNVDVHNRYFVIGMEHNSQDSLPLALYLSMEYCWAKIKEDRMRNKMLVCDEWWRFAFNPIAANKSLEIAKIARAYSCSCLFATQSMSDIFGIENGKYGSAVLNNCASKIILKCEDKDIESMRELVDLTQKEISAISRFTSGQGLLISGNSRMLVQFNPSESEKMLMFTDQETLIRVAQKQKEKEEHDALYSQDFAREYPSHDEYLKELNSAMQNDNEILDNDFISGEEYRKQLYEAMKESHV